MCSCAHVMAGESRWISAHSRCSPYSVTRFQGANALSMPRSAGAQLREVAQQHGVRHVVVRIQFSPVGE